MVRFVRRYVEGDRGGGPTRYPNAIPSLEVTHGDRDRRLNPRLVVLPVVDDELFVTDVQLCVPLLLLVSDAFVPFVGCVRTHGS